MPKNNLVYAVVLTWNHIEDTLECLESVLSSTYHPLKVLVTDNASQDGTVEVVKEKFPYVEVLALDKNYGVSGGYNRGIQYAIDHGAEYVLIANNDIQIHPEMLLALVDFLEQKPEAGMAMPKIYLYNDRTRLWCVGAKWRKFPPMVKMMGFNSPDTQKFKVPMQIEFAPSCVLLLKREAILSAGYFDENYFFYQDDWDYCIRYRKAGFEIWFVPGAEMWHKVSVSTQKSEKPSIWWVYFGRSVVRFYKKHSSISALFLFSVWFMIREILKGNFSRIKPFMTGLKTEKFGFEKME
jgi:GT2 family glycosyltransferase